MVIRRALFFWQFIAAVVLPTWVLIARGILGSSVGWDFVLFVVICPMLGIAMLGVAGFTFARKQVRATRAVSWLDAAVIGVWHATIVAYGFIDSSLIAVFIVVATIAAFWIAVWQLFSETRRRVRGVLASFEQSSQPRRPSSTGPNAGRVIILEPGETRDRQ